MAAPIAHAGDTLNRVVVIAAPQATPITRRLQQEIEALGFTVQLENRAFTERPEVELATRGAVAAIEVTTTSPGFIALYVLEPKTARIIRQELPIEAPNDPTATELVTTRAVELLRAARLEVIATRRADPAPPMKPPAARPELEIRAAQAKSKPSAELLLGAGPGLSYVPHWRASSSFGVTAVFVSARGIGWMAGVALPMTSSSTEVPGMGRIDAHATVYRFGGVFQAVHGDPLGLRLYTGVEGNQLRFVGHAESPYVGTTVYLSAWAPWLGVAANLRVSSKLQLVTQASGSWTMARTVVRVSGQELRDWGRPTMSLALTLEWQPL